MGAGVNWLIENRAQFHLAHARDHEEALQLIKPLGELALTASLFRRLDLHSLWADETLAFCWNELDGGEVLLRVLAARPDLVVASTIYAGFAEAGLTNERLDILLRHLAESPSCSGIEFPAWRRLDVAHGFSALGYRAFPAKPEVGTWLERFPEPWMMSEDIAYAVTHEVFYITDFGWSRGRLADEIRAYLCTWLPAWSSIWARQEHWDLLAEFAMVAGCLGQPCDGVLDRLVVLQDERGFFPGPRGSASLLISRQTEAGRGTFLANYHTTLVTLMALAFAHSHVRGCSR